MKPAAFEYRAPRTVDEALALLAEHGDDARPLAGGQTLVPAMNFRLATPAVLVDLNHVAALDHLETGPDGEIRIGAMTRQRRLEREPAVGRAAPLLAEALPHVAHVQIRNRGTLGGSLAHADAAAELPAVMLALDAGLHLQSEAGSRRVAVDDFFLGLLSTALEPGELLVEVVVPAPGPGRGAAFREIARRRGDYALMGVAAVVELDASDRVRGARIALLGAGDRPLLAAGAATRLVGETPGAAVIEEAARIAAHDDIDPPADLHAGVAYRRRLAEVLTRDGLTTAVARAGAGHG